MDKLELHLYNVHGIRAKDAETAHKVEHTMPYPEDHDIDDLNYSEDEQWPENRRRECVRTCRAALPKLMVM